MNKCLKNIALQAGFDKTISFGGKSDKSKRLEILRNGAIIKTYYDAVNGIFLDSDFSDEFETETIDFFIPESDVKELFDLDRFFDFRLIFGNDLVGFGGVQVFDSVPDCATNVQSSVNIGISQSENVEPFVLADIDVTPIVIESAQNDDFFDKLMIKHGFKP